jgi:hypothetical protein
MRATLVLASVIGVGLFAGTASAAPRPATVYLERNGHSVETDDETIDIPKFGGGDRAWAGIVACVKQHFAPFQVDITEARPARGPFITAVVGGLASQLGLDDRVTNGVGPYSGDVIANATVFIFSKVGTGERDVANLCAVTAHEIAHSLGLDHNTKCGDIMSYWLDRCGPRQFLDVSAPCGERGERTCGDGNDEQNSYRLLAAKVGLRSSPAGKQPQPDVDQRRPQDPWASPGDDPEADDDADTHGDEHEHDAQPQDPYAEDYYAPVKARRSLQRVTRPAGPGCNNHAWRGRR